MMPTRAMGERDIFEPKGPSPSGVPSRKSQPATSVGGARTTGFAIGQLIRNRYKVLGRAPFDQTVFRAKDLKSDRIVALRPLPPVDLSDTKELDLVRQEVTRLCDVRHPNLLELFEFESNDGAPFVVSELAKGFSLQELLQARRGIAWEETLEIAKPVAKVLDFISDPAVLSDRISPRRVFIEIPKCTEEPAELLQMLVFTWPPFTVKVDPLGFVRTERLSEEMRDPAAGPRVRTLALLVYELLGGAKSVTSVGLPNPGTNPLPALNASANATLSAGLTNPASFQTSSEFLTAMEKAAAERGNRGATVAPPKSARATVKEPAKQSKSPKVPIGGGLPRVSSWLPKIGTVALFVAIAAVAGVVADLVFRETQVSPPVPKQEAVAAPKQEAVPVPKQEAAAPKQEAAAVPKQEAAAAPKQEAAAAPRQEAAAVPKQEAAAAPKQEAAAAPKQEAAAPKQEAAAPKQEAAAPKQEAAAPKQEAAAPKQEAAAPKQEAVAVPKQEPVRAPKQQAAAAPKQEAVAGREQESVGVPSQPVTAIVGQISVKSSPAGSEFEISGANQEVNRGKTPMIVDNLPIGQYQVRLKRSGWPDYVEAVSVRPSATATIDHTFQGINVTLQSDPSGATIFMDQTELGKTPLKASLPPSPVELVSRIGALEPVSMQVTPDPTGTATLEFKHKYGWVAISSDRRHAEVLIEGFSFGKAPILGILPPGRHSVVVRASGYQDQTQVADVQAGQRIAMRFKFRHSPRLSDSTASPTPTAAPTASPSPRATPHSRQRQDAEADVPAGYRTREDYERAKSEAFQRFDAEWDAQKKALEAERDYSAYWTGHSTGAIRDQWNAENARTQERLNLFDSQRNGAKDALQKKWSD
jgi:hypothetical protein